MNKNELVSVMKKHGDNQADLAEYIGISLQRFNAKINQTNGAEFTRPEMQKVKEKYGLTSEQVDEIFLT
jgi:hypothetical protein